MIALYSYFSSIILYYLFPQNLYSFVIPWIKSLPALILSFYLRSKKINLHRAFILAAIGDFLLGYDYYSIWFFVLGMCFFTFVHIFFFLHLEKLNFQASGNKLRRYFFYCISISIFFLCPILSLLVFPIVFYALLLCDIADQAFLNLWHKFHFGCLLFVISDIVILFELIFGYWGIALPVYWTSLAFIAFSF